MEAKSRTELQFILTLIIVFFVNSEAVTVSPLCPTNKIAPHRRIASWGDDTPQPKTVGAFYDLLVPNEPQNLPGAMEEPLQDDPNDCGYIEDYDENDLTSLQSQRRQRGFRFFFGGSQYPNERPPQAPSRPPRPPIRPPYNQNMNQGTTNRPFRPQQTIYPAPRPPYASGGFFSGNPYRPPSYQYPSNDVKPVHEDNFENYVPYRPGVVGGPVGHIIGVSPAKPTGRPDSYTTTRRPPNNVNHALQASNQNFAYPTRPERPRNLSTSLFSSFLDLLL